MVVEYPVTRRGACFAVREKKIDGEQKPGGSCQKKRRLVEDRPWEGVLWDEQRSPISKGEEASCVSWSG